MSWVTISLRKMTLKNRINNLESELIRISQQLQTVANNESYNQQADQLNHNYNVAAANAAYQESLNGIDTNADGDNEKQLEAQRNIANVTLAYNNQMQMEDSIFEAKNSARQRMTDAQSNALEAQQEQVETQLKAAKAEYDSLGEAVKDDIKRDTISLA